VDSNNAEVLREIPSILNAWGIKCRGDDGQLVWVNFSIPKSVDDTIVIGLRYQKRDQTVTEDIFELNRSSPERVYSHYKGMYETYRPEYQGTHKFQNAGTHSFTTANTCCLFIGYTGSS
jgi:hypothetical protein